MKFCSGWKQVKNQFITVMCANLMSMAHGGLMGWFSPARLVLEKDGSPIGKLSDTSGSWLSSCSYIGGFFGTILFMYITKWFGRKITFFILAVPNFIFWLAVVLSKHLSWLIVARVLGGFVGGGTYIAVPLLVTEIADDHVRGILGSMLVIFVNVGLMMAYVTGKLMTYHTMPYVMMIFPVGVIVAFIFIPDTPMSLIYRHKSDEAVEKSLKFYLNISDIESENNKERFEKALEGVRALVEKKKNESKFTLGDLFEKKALSGLGKSFAMVFLSIFCGSPVLQNYSSKVFEDSGSSIDPGLSAIIMICIQVIATLIAIFIVDRFGRRLLLIVSSLGAVIGLVIMGIFSYYARPGQHDYDMKAWNWVPIVSVSFYVFTAYIGLIPLVFVVIMEVLPAKVREFYATCCLSLVSLFMFIIVKVFPLASNGLGIYTCMWFFAAVSFLAVVFGLFILEETKGKDVNA